VRVEWGTSTAEHPSVKPRLQWPTGQAAPATIRGRRRYVWPLEIAPNDDILTRRRVRSGSSGLLPQRRGYDANAGALETVRHLIVEAQRAEGAPPGPFHEGVPAGVLQAHGRQVAVLECPPDSPQARATIRHGEGAHVEHLLAYWDSQGIRYVVSVHRTTAGDGRLLKRLISAIELIGP
jgi:hypothetical protein